MLGYGEPLDPQDAMTANELQSAVTRSDREPSWPSVQLIEHRSLLPVDLDDHCLPVAGRHPPAEPAEPTVNNDATLPGMTPEKAPQAPGAAVTQIAHQ
jgi:hypothetical protein